jgi:tetratricopeptide (TPR) repeat protein
VLFAVGRANDSYLNQAIAKKFFEKGQYYYNGGEFNISEAQKWYYWANFFDTKFPLLHYQWARTYLVSGEFEKGIAEINKEIQNYPDNKRAYYVKGLLDSYADRNDEAVADFKEFIAWKPNGWAAYADLSWVYIKKEAYLDVIETTNQGLGYFPQNPWLLSNQGLAHYRLGDYESAKEDLEKAKNLSEKLTPEEWKRAYPGNNPSGAEQGVSDVKAIISYNLMLSYMKLGEIENYLKEKDNYNVLINKNVSPLTKQNKNEKK